MSELSELLDVLELEPVGEGRFRAQNFGSAPGGVVFGGQLLAQTIMAAATVDPTKEVKTVHTVFARGGALDQPLDIELDVMHTGRARQHRGDDPAGRSSLHPLDRLAEHGRARPDPPWRRCARRRRPPERAVASAGEGDFWEVRVVDGVSLSDPDAVGPPELFGVEPLPGGGATGAKGQALLAYATDGFLIGTAMRPHEGIGQSMSHVSISTSVLGHTLTFHEPIDAAALVLLSRTRARTRGGGAPTAGPTSSTRTAALWRRSCRTT